MINIDGKIEQFKKTNPDIIYQFEKQKIIYGKLAQEVSYTLEYLLNEEEVITTRIGRH